MDRFIASENIKHFRDRRGSESDPRTRSRSVHPLMDEEDRLGVDPELLAEADGAIAIFDALIEAQRALVAAQERDGHSGLTQSQVQASGDVQPRASVNPQLLAPRFANEWAAPRDPPLWIAFNAHAKGTGYGNRKGRGSAGRHC
jgi:hypothetical protein